jgi:tetratricopeptide (TPR) repeat protein
LHRTLAEAADPLMLFNRVAIARLLIWRGRLDEALVKIQKLGEVDPDGLLYHFIRARYLLARSDLQGCLKELKRCEEVTPGTRSKPVIRALYCALAGDKEQARTLLRDKETLPEFPPTRWGMLWAYCELGDPDECFRWLEEAVASHSIAFQSLRLDPLFEQVRADPRFQTLLKKMNLA